MEDHTIADRPVPESAGLPSGRLGVWVFLASEVATFGGLLTLYALLRLRHPEWAEGARQTLLPIGIVNTIVLLTSSLTMARAHETALLGDAGGSMRWLWGTVALGVLFLGLKGFEYAHEIAEGRVPAAGGFWAFYFSLTGLHGLHVLAGLAALSGIGLLRDRRRALAWISPVGLYWCFVDVVWIFLFPLLYISSRG